MKKMNKWSLLVYLAEILLLIAAITAVVRLVPDLRKKPSAHESAPSATESSAQEETEETEEGLPLKEGEAGENAGGPDGAGEHGETGAGDENGGGNENGGRDENGGSQKGHGGAANDRDSWTQAGTGAATRPGTGDSGEQGADGEAENVYVPPTMIIASDLHYMSPTMTDFGEVFDQYLENSDGRVMPYLDQITDAFLEEVVMQKPSVLILSGDISQDGEKVNHGELARKLRRVQAAGVPVLVIPGNHDINHPDAATYYGSDVTPTEAVDADGFYEIYHEFGYDGAADRDESSLSYLYKLDEKYWLMMLDSCIYYPENEVGGRIGQDTLR